MGSIITDIQEKFRRGNICTRLIFINAAVFIVVELTDIILRLFNLPDTRFFRWVEMPASPVQFLRQPWSILTYMFMHAGVLHILFNMLWLYWFGEIFLRFFSAKHLRGVYLLGGICGALLYLLSFNLFPYFRPLSEYSYLLGASASVLAIVVAAAYREPNFPIRLLLLGTVRLKYLALAVVALDLLFITADNAGGHIAHLGGALGGWWFAVALDKGTDLTTWINRPLDSIARLTDGKRRKPKMKVHYNPNRQQDYDYNARKKNTSEEIDRILDKLKKSGYDSLSTEEKKTLFNASKR